MEKHEENMMSEMTMLSTLIYAAGALPKAGKFKLKWDTAVTRKQKCVPLKYISQYLQKYPLI